MKTIVAFFLGLFSIFSHAASSTPIIQNVSTSTIIVATTTPLEVQISSGTTSVPIKHEVPVNVPTASTISVATTTNVSIKRVTPINVSTVGTISALTLSSDPSTPLSSTIITSQGSNKDEALGVQGLVFDITNNTANSITTALNIVMQFGSASASAPASSVTTAYLFGGSNEISSADVVNGESTFSNVNFSIPAHSLRTLRVLFDAKNVSGSSTIVPSVVSVSPATSQGGTGPTPTVSGYALGNTLTVINTNTSNPSNPSNATVAVVPTIVFNQSSSAPLITATFDVSIQAIGGDFSFANGSVSAKPFDFSIYKNGVSNDMSAYSYTESFVIPTSGIVTQGLLNGMAFKLLQNNTITIPVTLNFTPTGSTANYYVSLNSVTVENDNGQTQVIPADQTTTATISTAVANNPTAATWPTITPSSQVVTSGGAAQFAMTFPSNTTKAQLYFSCPAGVTIVGNVSCNSYNDVTNNTSSNISFTLINGTSQSLTVPATLYVYTPNGYQNYPDAVGASIVVQP